MKHIAVTALFAFASNIVLAGDVGAHYPQGVNIAPTSFAVAVAETGASTSWTTETFEALAKGDQTKEFNERVAEFNALMQKELEESIAKNFEHLISH